LPDSCMYTDNYMSTFYVVTFEEARNSRRKSGLYYTELSTEN